MAAGTRTAPAFTASATARQITLRLIDASGDLYSVNKQVAVAATAANIEAWAAAYAAASQASLYEIDDHLLRVGDADPDNADTGDRDSVADGINLAYKNPTTLQTYTDRLVAPIGDVMQGNQDIPLLSATELANLITAELAITTGFNFQSGQYTERRERKNNPRVK
jgi:hypothetical protein